MRSTKFVIKKSDKSFSTDSAVYRRNQSCLPLLQGNKSVHSLEIAKSSSEDLAVKFHKREFTRSLEPGTAQGKGLGRGL